MEASQTVLQQTHVHPHRTPEVCPACEQPISNEKAIEIRARFEAQKRELVAAAESRAAQLLVQEKAKIEATAQQKINALTAKIAEREATAREEGKKAAEAAATKQLAAVQSSAKAREDALQERLATAEQAKLQLETASRERIAAAERDKLAAISQFQDLKASHDNEIQNVRDAMQRDKTDALNAQSSRHFEATQKLTGQLADLQRQLEKKTADELGEGAEINLYDCLCDEFPGDRIERVGRGAAGADIILEVMHNGESCGRIVFDSKNAKAWRSDYVAKLRKDQIAARADHAILSILKFPAEMRQLYIEEGVIIANPARVVTIVHLLRKHLIEVHALRLSKAERAKKMAALYDYMTSKRCSQFLDTIDDHAGELLELQEKERRQHEATWKRQGTLCRSIQKARADFAAEIDQIIGTDGPAN